MLPSSLDLRPGCSFARAKYVGEDPRAVLDTQPGSTGLAATQSQLLPSPPLTAPTKSTFRFEAADVPLEGQDPHCEIRIVPHPGSYNKNFRVRSPVVLVYLQEELARCLRVVLSP